MLHLRDDSHSVLVGKLELELDADYELLNHTVLTMGFFSMIHIQSYHPI